MRSDTHTYKVAITKTDGNIVVITTQAESKWEAEDRLHSRFIREQPLRTAYSAHRSRSYAKQKIRGGL
jgi:hypothetical protein